jgi:hypothetical protein
MTRNVIRDQFFIPAAPTFEGQGFERKGRILVDDFILFDSFILDRLLGPSLPLFWSFFLLMQLISSVIGKRLHATSSHY